MKVRKFFVAADSHVLMKAGRVAGVDIKTNNAVVSYLENEGPWDGYIHLGDNYDLNCISDHNKGRLKLVEGERLYDDYRAGNAYLTQHFIAAQAPSKFYLLEGNHEQRVQRYVEARPELSGFVDLKKHLPEFVTYIPFWSQHELLKIGHATFIHGTGTARYQVTRALKDYGSNVFMGHSHRREVASLRYHGPDATKVAESLPCLCEYGQSYLKGSPTAWQQGFATFYFWPNGVFNYTVTSIFDHAFISPSGRYYDGKKVRPETKLVIE